VRFSQHVHREGRRDSSSETILEGAAAVRLQQEQVLLSLAGVHNMAVCVTRNEASYNHNHHHR